MADIDFIMRPGPSRQQPVTMSIRYKKPNEDGERGGMELHMPIAEARAMAYDILQACDWVESGAWKPRAA